MKRNNFVYNRPEANCDLCQRARNPHPDFDEPLVVTDIQLNKKTISICINCYEELEIIAFKTKQTVLEILREKINLIKLLNRVQVSNKNY